MTGVVSTPSLRILSRFALIAAIGIVAIVAGIAVFMRRSVDEPINVAEEQEAIALSAEAFVLNDGDTAVAVENAIVHYRGSEEIARIDAPGVTDVEWFGTEVLWIDKSDDENIFSITAFSPDTGERRVLYTSLSPLHHLGVSADEQFISFYQDSALMVLAAESGEVRRVAQDVNFAQWSPVSPALVFSVPGRVSYADIDESGSVVSYVDLPATLTSVAFQDASTLIALGTNNAQTELVSIDLSADSAVATPIAEQLALPGAGPHSIHIIDAQTAVVYTENTEDSEITRVSLNDGKAEKLKQRGSVLDIDPSGNIVYRTPEHQIAELNSTSLQQTIRTDAGIDAAVYSSL